jgi:hypothetical protein
MRRRVQRPVPNFAAPRRRRLKEQVNNRQRGWGKFPMVLKSLEIAGERRPLLKHGTGEWRTAP